MDRQPLPTLDRTKYGAAAAWLGRLSLADADGGSPR